MTPLDSDPPGTAPNPAQTLRRAARARPNRANPPESTERGITHRCAELATCVRGQQRAEAPTVASGTGSGPDSGTAYTVGQSPRRGRITDAAGRAAMPSHPRRETPR